MIEEQIAPKTIQTFTNPFSNHGTIDNRACIDPYARIGKNVSIGPWCVIGPNVEIGDDTWIGPHVVINGPTKIGTGNKIFQFSSIGEDPQDKKFEGEKASLEIGNDNTIREFCTISRGTGDGGGLTKIGSNNWIMATVHIAHDCIIGNHTIFTNYAAVAGHVTVEDYAILSAYTAVHQFCTIGAHSFVAKASYITKDIVPYVMVNGYSPTTVGINVECLKRRGFTAETITNLRRAYKIIFRRGLTVEQALVELEGMLADCPEILPLMDAMKNSQRGIVR